MSAIERPLIETATVISIKSRLDTLEAKTATLGTSTQEFKGYLYLNEFRQVGETNDNLALQRAKIAQGNTGFPIFLAPGKGSGQLVDDGVDKFTGQAIAVKYRGQVGDYLIDSWSQTSDTNSGTTGASGSLSNPNDTGNMWSNMQLIGLRGQSRVRKATVSKPFIFTCNPVNTPGTTVAGEDVQSYVYKNIRFAGLTFVSNVQSDGYDEYMAQVQLNAVECVKIEDCDFIGFRGDAIQIGNGHIGNGTQNRHNRDIILRDLKIDGANQNNRNPVMVTDCDGMLMDNVRTTQCGKPGSSLYVSPVPTGVAFNKYNPLSGNGSLSSLITLQQNALVTKSILRNITVRDCSAHDGGAHGVALIVNFNAILKTDPTQDIEIRDNTFKRCKSGIFAASNNVPSGASYEYDITFAGNTVSNCVYSFDISTINGLNITQNTFVDCSRNGLVGIDYGIAYTNISNNTFRRCGYLTYGAFMVVGCSGRISYNRFEDCVYCDFSIKGIGTLKDLTIDQNEVINTDAANPKMFYTMPMYDTLRAGVVTWPDVRTDSVFVTYHPSNNLPVLPVPNTFAVNGARHRSFPKGTSLWPNGSTVTSRADLPRGEIFELRKTGAFTGPSPADRWTPSFLGGGIPVLTTALPTGYVAPAQNDNNGSPQGIVVDDNNRLLCVRNTECFWKSSSEATTTGSSRGYPWLALRVAAPSLMSNGVMVGFTHDTRLPDNWIAGNSSFGIIKFGVHFDSGNMRMIVGGAIAATVAENALRTVIGNPQVFLNVIVTLLYNQQTGECRVAIVHPETKTEVTVGTTTTSATGQRAYPMVRMTNVNEFLRIYN